MYVGEQMAAGGGGLGAQNRSVRHTATYLSRMFWHRNIERPGCAARYRNLDGKLPRQ
jgi:hypothetical protein